MDPKDDKRFDSPASEKKSGGSVDTGDDSQTGLWLSVMILSLAALTAVFVMVRKRKA